MSDRVKRGRDSRPPLAFSEQRRALLEQLLNEESAQDKAVEAIRPCGHAGPYPMSFAQERLWFLDQLSPGNPFYNVQVAIRHRGPLEPAMLERAFDAVVERHAVLRTVFALRDGSPVQTVLPTLRIPLAVCDLRGLPPGARESEAIRIALEERARPYDLSKGPLGRIKLLQLSDRDHVILLGLHHIVADGWSMGVLARELGASYESYAAGRGPTLPRLPVQYSDFAVWQREQLTGDRLEAELSYWRQALDGLPELALPLDFPRPAVQAHRGAGLQLSLPSELVERLTRRGRECRATLFMVLLAALGVVLGRWSGQDEVVVGAPVAGRQRTELEGLIGFFVNTLVLRLDLRGDPTFGELVERTREVALGAYAHAELPFEKLVDEIADKRDLSRNPLFQVTLQLFDSPTAPDLVQARAGLELPVTSSLFDLRVDLWPAAGGLAGRVEFDTDLFERPSVEWLLDRYRLVLEQAAEEPARRLSELSLLPPAHARLLHTWNDTTAPTADETVVERVQRWAATAPHRPAVADGEGEWSYGELNGRANRLCRRLLASGVRPGDVVAICVPRSRAFAACTLAVLKAGAAYLPLDASSPPARLARLLAEARPRVALVAGAAALEPLGAQVVDVTDWPEGDEENVDLAISSDSSAYVIFTSGSTGAPKGVVLGHPGLLNLVDWHVERYGIGEADRGSMVASYGFDAAVWELWPYLCVGAAVDVCDDETRTDGERLLAWLASRGTTVAFVPTPLTEVLLGSRWPRESRLRFLLTGGDRLRRFANPAHPYTLVNHYGPTEVTVLATAGTVEGEPLPGRQPTIGRPVRNAACYVVDPSGSLLGPGCPGELWLGGAGIAQGYLGDPELTAERFVANPFDDRCERLYKTGDLVRWREDGTLAFLGRGDDQVKVRGHRVEPREIEALLAEHPDIGQAVVRTTPSADGDASRLVAYVVSAEGRTADRVRRLEHWHSLYEAAYDDGEPEDPEFDIRGWNSSYDGKPLGEAVMREQVDQTVERIAALEPQRILEVGCGTGLLLYRLAPVCERYCATDFSAVALARLRRRVEERGWRHVELRERAADHLDDLVGSDFDVVVLNSVVQYFPDADYLERVLAGAIRCLRPGGAIFVGDVRNLALLDAFHTSVELAAGPADLPVAELRRRIRRRVETEQELVLDPAWFTRFALDQRPPLQVAVEPRRGRILSELTRFRYDVVLRVEAEPLPPPDVALGWKSVGSIDALARLLEDTDGSVWVRGIPSARVADCVHEVRRLATAPGEQAAGALRAELANARKGVDPEALWTLSTQHRISLAYDRSGETGAYDVLATAESDARALPPPPVHDGPLANNPLRHDRIHAAELRTWLQERLPEQMVPSAIVPIEAIPLTPNGKVDTAALPSPEQPRVDPTGSGAPSSETERRLAELWAGTLGLERVGMHDNFFELGGDSILSIMLASRAAEAGLHFTTKQLFQNQTVAELARVVSATRRLEAEQGPVIGDVPLTPIQLWLVEQDLADLHHFNQAALLPVARTVNLNLLVRALHAVVTHHDALHLRFARAGDGWRQWSEPPARELPVATADLTRLPPAERPAALERAAAKLQASLSLDGPLVRVALFDLGLDEPRRLLVAIHHLVVDGVSWRVLLEDLWRAYGQLVQGVPVSLPQKTSSFRQWAERLLERAAAPEVEAQAAFWLAQLPSEPPRLPRDRPGTDNTVAVTRSVRVALTAADTDDLLRRALVERGVQINDVLLWALARALQRWTGWSDVPVAVEGHGREALFDDVDLTRTVGWFTTIWPLLLDLPVGTDGGDGPAVVAEQLGRVPDGGVGYGLLRHLGADRELRSRLGARDRWPEVSFNYLGRLDDDGAAADPLRERTGPVRSPAGARPHLLEANGAVTGGRLQFDFFYSSAIHDETTIEAVAHAFLEELRAVLAPIGTASAAERLDATGVSTRDLETVLAHLAADAGRSP
jgi:amino acid adenylation domain-containing protein/non-ribosomal peptide synthase protein (TIGR01720 family)